MLLSGCGLTRHYKKVATDIDVTLKKKSIIAPWVAVNFPSVTKVVPGKIDTVETIYYDEIAIDDLNHLVDSLLLRPEVVKLLKEKCIPIVKTKYITKVDTVFTDNAAKIFTMQQSIARLESANVKLSLSSEDKDKKISDIKRQRNIFIGILSGIVLLTGVIIYFKLK